MENDKKKKLTLILATVAALTLIGLIGAVTTGFFGLAAEPEPGNLDEFAQCLSDKGFVLAGTDWCPHCQDQKKAFGSSVQYINFKNCDFEKDWCNTNGVQYYPTWILPDGSQVVGNKSMETLAELSGCEI